MFVLLFISPFPCLIPIPHSSQEVGTYMYSVKLILLVRYNFDLISITQHKQIHEQNFWETILLLHDTVEVGVTHYNCIIGQNL